MSTYVLSLHDIDSTQSLLAGGKAANLGELTKIMGIHVPEGFCVTTEAYRKMTSDNVQLDTLLHRLSGLDAEDQEQITKLSKEIRTTIENIPIPNEIAAAISSYLDPFHTTDAFAVRSSATAEDLPTASFAGQQDTYLNIIGKDAILQHVSKCWASLFTERAIVYRMKNGFDQRQVYLSVIVQKMVLPHSSGILFTADPITGNRKLLSIDAGFGLGDALVSGLVAADGFKVQGEKVVERRIATHQQQGPTLTEQQALQLSRIGRTIEEHFGRPQDIEWCLADNTFFIVQSRPITTLYPIPEVPDHENHVYISVGHQQMMTDPLKPLGLSIFQLTAFRPMYEAGGRLFIDVTSSLADAAGRATLLANMGQHDPLIKDALVTLIEQRGFVELPRDEKSDPAAPQNDASIIPELINRTKASIASLRANIQTKSGPALFEFIKEDIQQFKKTLFDPENMSAIMTAVSTSSWINENMSALLGEKNVADTLSQSAPHNITSEMGLALLDVADAIRPYPEVIEYLQQVNDDNFLDKLSHLNGGPQARHAICAYLDKYGMRCVGEIDISRPRWSEQPTTLIPLILSNIKNFGPGAARQRFEQGQEQAMKKEQDLLHRLEQLPDGEKKTAETRRVISLLRDFIGYREYPKYGIVNRYFIYKQALLKEAEQLLKAGLIREKDDIWYLTFDELQHTVSTAHLDYQLIKNRKDEHRANEKLTPPRVITSDGEIIAGRYKKEYLPPGALAGLAVSRGVVEGRARVILNLEDADLREGDILVTSFTDPSWTPLFVAIKGLVTEVGGLMTHGAVIAREYGLPAVIGVENATRLIKDGQRIRVNGTDGFVEIPGDV